MFGCANVVTPPDTAVVTQLTTMYQINCPNNKNITKYNTAVN